MGKGGVADWDGSNSLVTSALDPWSSQACRGCPVRQGLSLTVLLAGLAGKQAAAD